MFALTDSSRKVPRIAKLNQERKVTGKYLENNPLNLSKNKDEKNIYKLVKNKITNIMSSDKDTVW